MAAPSLDCETRYWNAGYATVAGVDEVGRGALAGPVVAVAATLSPNLEAAFLEQLNDSKQLTAAARQRTFEAIKARREIEYAAGVCEAAEIDELGIVGATARAMRRALKALPRPAQMALIDGRPLSELADLNAEFIIKGDARSRSIAAASIIAKALRDELMSDELAPRYPQYAFAQNKGYGTADHLKALREHGATPQHRRSFNPLKSALRQPQFASLQTS